MIDTHNDQRGLVQSHWPRSDSSGSPPPPREWCATSRTALRIFMVLALQSRKSPLFQDWTSATLAALPSVSQVGGHHKRRTVCSSTYTRARFCATLSSGEGHGCVAASSSASSSPPSVLVTHHQGCQELTSIVRRLTCQLQALQTEVHRMATASARPSPSNTLSLPLLLSPASSHWRKARHFAQPHQELSPQSESVHHSALVISPHLCHRHHPPLHPPFWMVSLACVVIVQRQFHRFVPRATVAPTATAVAPPPALCSGFACKRPGDCSLLNEGAMSSFPSFSPLVMGELIVVAGGGRGRRRRRRVHGLGALLGSCVSERYARPGNSESDNGHPRLTSFFGTTVLWTAMEGVVCSTPPSNRPALQVLKTRNFFA